MTFCVFSRYPFPPRPLESSPTPLPPKYPDGFVLASPLWIMHRSWKISRSQLNRFPAPSLLTLFFFSWLFPSLCGHRLTSNSHTGLGNLRNFLAEPCLSVSLSFQTKKSTRNESLSCTRPQQQRPPLSHRLSKAISIFFTCVTQEE